MSRSGKALSTVAHTPPTTVNVGRGELDVRHDEVGCVLAWLWPSVAPRVEPSPSVLCHNGRLEALALRPGQTLTIKRTAVQMPELVGSSHGYELSVPSDTVYADVSRAPTRITLHDDGRLAIQTDAKGPRRVWIDLSPVGGPSPELTIAHWSAVAVGPIVLWHLPQSIDNAWLYLRAVDISMRESFVSAGFNCFTPAMASVISQLRRRARMRVAVPKNRGATQWKACQPFLLAGEPGCGKTTLAKAVYGALAESGAAPKFSVLHPVAAEHEVDLVALVGSANFAHDGIKVPDQAGALHAALAEGGVVLIDEVHTLGERLRQQLIDILTEWTFRPRGDTTHRKQIRGLLVFATNRLDVVCDSARFPQDLFARMGGQAGVIELPPLRQRRWELPRLAQAVCRDLKPTVRFSPDATRKILLHAWPLNHWELEDVVREAHSRAVFERRDTIGPQDLIVQPNPSAIVEIVDATQLTAPATRAGGSVKPPFCFPETVRWHDLFAASWFYPGFSELRDAWQTQLGAKNPAAINRRIGRLIRCDACAPQSCPRCFCGALTQSDSASLLAQFETYAERYGIAQHGVHTWVTTACRVLLVDRLDLFRGSEVIAELGATDHHGLMRLFDALRCAIS